MNTSDIIIVSACLAGVKCRYNGTSGKIKEIEDLVLSGRAIQLCPEVLGGLGFPREPCEIVTKDKKKEVISREGKNMTRFFYHGAKLTLAVAKTVGASKAILKSRSPSCGYGGIYDGTFSDSVISENGITAELLIKNNIKVFTEDNYSDAIIKI